MSKEALPEYFECGKIAWQPGLCPNPAGELIVLPQTL